MAVASACSHVLCACVGGAQLGIVGYALLFSPLLRQLLNYQLIVNQDRSSPGPAALVGIRLAPCTPLGVLTLALDIQSINSNLNSCDPPPHSLPALMSEGTPYKDAVEGAPPYRLAMSPQKRIHEEVSFCGVGGCELLQPIS